jgi:D-glycero-D-manno-heptose 1,7-bisphosphate phosphatase
VGVATVAGRRAVFLDRDGVLTGLVRHAGSAERESPHSVRELRLRPKALESMRRLQRAGYELFVVSNQPSFAKGKAPLEDLRAVAAEFERRVARSGVTLRATYYCFHHPQGTAPGYGRRCRCRKPSPYFLKLAARRFGIDLARSWMVGDRVTDIECGRRAGCRTVFIARPAMRAPGDVLMADNVRVAARAITASGRTRKGT